jgi:hypothetical protein
MLSGWIPMEYSFTLVILPYPFNVGFTVSSASQLGGSRRIWDSWFRLGEVEPSFKEFLASTAYMRFQI